MKHRNLKITFEIDGITFVILSIGKDPLSGPIPRHSHSKNSYEMHYISDGYGTLIADKNKYELAPGLFYMTGPGVEHEQISDPENPMIEYGVYLQIVKDKKVSKNSPVRPFIDNKFWLGTINEKVCITMDNILFELENHPFGYEEMLPSLLKQLTISIIREYSHENQKEKDQSSRNISPEDLIYLTIEEAFLYNFKDLSLEILAKEINLGLRQTERILKNHYGKTFSQMKTDARMSAASLLLTETSDSISIIAEKLGYSSSEHFTNAFKSYYKLSPTKYRKEK